MPDYAYKSEIEKLVAEFPARYVAPESGPREFPLPNRCRADFCYHIRPTGQLFIEDDDGMRGLSNLIKYWMWCDTNPSDRPVHVIHILETSRVAAIKSIEFLAQKMEADIKGFHYHIITISHWHVAHEEWLGTLQAILSEIDNLCEQRP